MILVAGGAADPNIACLLRRLAERRMPHIGLCPGAERPPRFAWHLDQSSVWIDNTPVEPSAAFLRYDVFTQLQQPNEHGAQRASRWYFAIFSWILAHPHVAVFNRRFGASQVVKPYVLRLARAAGLPIATTVITNDLQDWRGESNPGAWIVKPVDGGEFTRPLADVVPDGPGCQPTVDAPVIVQRRLRAPDLRLYRIGDAWFAFTLDSEELDYRTKQRVRIEPVEVPPLIADPLRKLMDGLGLDFGAADFKRCAETGQWTFLEVNSAPMFYAFDRAIRGGLTDALIDWLATAAPEWRRPADGRVVDDPGRAAEFGDAMRSIPENLIK